MIEVIVIALIPAKAAKAAIAMSFHPLNQSHQSAKDRWRPIRRGLPQVRVKAYQ